MARLGLLILLSSPSGAGKSTLAKRIMAWDPSVVFSVSATTRSMRPGEANGKDYHFLSKEEFEAEIAADRMLEHAEVFDHFYGSPRGAVEQAIDAGRDVLFDVDWQGAQQISQSPLSKHVLSIFILPPSINELRYRLETRGQDSSDTISRRMEQSWCEISHWKEYDFVLINDDLTETETRLKSIIQAERLRRVQQPGLQAHTERLRSEFEDNR